jgi:hypothetical protein
LRFHASERHPGAGVNAGREGEMPVRLTPDVEAIRIGKLVRVPIGGADADMHVSPGRNIDAAKDGILDGAPIAELV